MRIGLRSWRERRRRESEEALTVRGEGWALRTAGPPTVSDGQVVSVATVVNTGTTRASFSVPIHVVAEGRRIGTLHARRVCPVHPAGAEIRASPDELPSHVGEGFHQDAGGAPGGSRKTVERYLSKCRCPNRSWVLPLTECVVCARLNAFAARYRSALESPHATKNATGDSWGCGPGLGRVVELALVSSSRGEQRGRIRSRGRAGLPEPPIDGELHQPLASPCWSSLRCRWQCAGHLRDLQRWCDQQLRCGSPADG